jgi:hypothetical protein
MGCIAAKAKSRTVVMRPNDNLDGQQQDDHEKSNRKVCSALVAVIPVLALSAGVPFANRLEPRILGMPFLVGYLTVWVLLTPGFLLLTNALRKRK